MPKCEPSIVRTGKNTFSFAGSFVRQLFVVSLICGLAGASVYAETIAEWQYNEISRTVEPVFVKGSLAFGDGKNDRPFSLEWVQKGTTARGEGLKAKQTAASQQIFKCAEFYVGWSNAFRIRLVGKDGEMGKRGSIDPMPGQWTHIAVTYDGKGSPDGIKLYQDGRLVSGQAERKGHYTTIRGSAGKYLVGDNFNGILKKLRIHDRELFPEEVIQAYAAERKELPIREMRQSPLDPAQADFSIPMVEGAPAVDGKLDDSIWQGAVWHELTALKGTADKNLKTRFACVHDADRLYFAIRCSEPEMDKIQIGNHRRDGKVWLDDSIELFIDTGYGKEPWHYHWAVNADGSLYDAQHAFIRSANRVNTGWDSDIELKTSKNKDGWEAELAIPFYELAFASERPDIFSLNICRNRRTTERPEAYSYVKDIGGFHHDHEYAVVKLEQPEKINPLYDMAIKDVKFTAAGDRLTVTLSLAAWLPEDGNFTLRLNSIETDSMAFPLSSKSRDWVLERIQLPLAAQNANAVMTLILKDQKNARILCRRSIPIDLTYAGALSVKLLQPHYNNAIYSDQNIDALVFGIDADNKGDRLIFSMSDSANRLLSKKTFIVAETSNTYSIPLPAAGLENGEYTLSWQLLAENGNFNKGRWEKKMQKLPYQKGQVTFDRDWNCLVDGKTEFFFGANIDYRLSKGLADANEMGMNAIILGGYRSLNQRMADALVRSGQKIITTPFGPGTPIYKYETDPETIKPLSASDEKDISEYVSKWGCSEALLGWYSRNEPPAVPAMLEYNKALHRTIRRSDPYHPILSVDCNIGSISYFSDDGSTIVCPDPYPAFIDDGINSQKPNHVFDAVQEAQRVNQGQAAVWAFLQAFNFSYFLKNKPDWREPRFQGLRNQMYQAIVAGAKGLLWYEVGHGDYYPEIRYGLTFLGQEAKLLKPAFMAPSDKEAIEILSQLPLHSLHYDVRKAGGQWFVFVVSTSRDRRSIRVRLKNFSGERLFVFSEQRAINVDQGILTDLFEPFQTHIYTTDEALAGKLDIAGLMRQCADALKEKREPGNLLYGAKAEVSWPLNVHGVQSGGRGVFLTGRPEYMIDSIPFTSCNGRLTKTGGTVTIHLQDRQNISSVVLDSNIEDADIEVKIAGHWQPLAAFKAVNPDLRREKYRITFPQASAEALKIKIKTLKKIFGMPDNDLQVWEIEAYK